MKKKFILSAFVAANIFVSTATAQTMNEEELIAINEFNLQNNSVEILDKEKQGYEFMVQNVLDTNATLKYELQNQIADAKSIGDIERVKTLQAYYNNLTDPYIISFYNSDIDISNILLEDTSVLNEMREDLNQLYVSK